MMPAAPALSAAVRVSASLRSRIVPPVVMMSHRLSLHPLDASAAPHVVVQPPDQSYDGEFFYRMAVAPLSTEQWESGVRFDDPALRWSRIVYPTMAFGLSLDHADLAPLALLVINVIAVGFVAAAGASLAKAGGRPWFQGLVLLLLPGVTYAITGALSDAVAIALVASSLSCLARKRPVVRVVGASQSALTDRQPASGGTTVPSRHAASPG